MVGSTTPFPRAQADQPQVYYARLVLTSGEVVQSVPLQDFRTADQVGTYSLLDDDVLEYSVVNDERREVA